MPDVRKLAQRYMFRPVELNLSRDEPSVESIKQYYVTVEHERPPRKCSHRPHRFDVAQKNESWFPELPAQVRAPVDDDPLGPRVECALAERRDDVRAATHCIEVG